MRTQWNDAEDDALHGLPWIAQLVYLRAIRPYMDFSSGIVGIKRGISRKSIAEMLHVEAKQGRKVAGDPSEKAIRHALELLEEEGLIVTMSTDRKLVFRLPLADTDDSVSEKRGRFGADLGPINTGRSESSNDTASGEKRGRFGADPKPEKWGRPPLSVIRKEIPDSDGVDREGGVGGNARSRGSRLSIPDLPDEWRAFVIDTRPDLDPEFCWQKFRDYWVGVPGQKGCKLDWLATWRNFIRSEHTQRRNGQVNGHDHHRESAAERRARINAEFIDAGKRAFKSEMG